MIYFFLFSSLPPSSFLPFSLSLSAFSDNMTTRILTSFFSEITELTSSLHSRPLFPTANSSSPRVQAHCSIEVGSWFIIQMKVRLSCRFSFQPAGKPTPRLPPGCNSRAPQGTKLEKETLALVPKINLGWIGDPNIKTSEKNVKGHKEI